MATAQTTQTLPRDLTRKVMVKDVAVGGGAPVTVQSMCTTKTADAQSTLAQINRLADAGCEIITLSAEDLATMQASAATVYDMVRSDLGDELVDQLLDAVKAAS